MTTLNNIKILDNTNLSKVISADWYVLSILSLLMGFVSISTDVYLPAMPAMARSLNTTAGLVDLTISSYLIGFSLGQLFWGPISDRYGRRFAIGIGLCLFIIGSGACAFSGSIFSIIIWRIIQAIGASASVALSRAMVRDLYEGDKSAQMLSTLMTVMAIAPLIGPLIGGEIAALFGWQVIFMILTIIGFITFLSLFTIPETLPTAYRNYEPLSTALLRYFGLLKSRKILGYAGAGGFLYAGVFAYVAGTPFAYITYYHVPSKFYGLLFALGVIGIMGANYLNSRMVIKFGYDMMLLFGTISAAFAGVMTLIATATGFGLLWGLAIPLFMFISTTGFVVANSITGALADYPERAGAVSALIGAIQYGSGIIGSGLVGIFANGTPIPMGCVIAIAGVGSLLSMFLIMPSKN